MGGGREWVLLKWFAVFFSKVEFFTLIRKDSNLASFKQEYQIGLFDQYVSVLCKMVLISHNHDKNIGSENSTENLENRTTNPGVFEKWEHGAKIVYPQN